MKVFESKSKNLAYFFYRLINPIFDPIKFFQGIYGYFWYMRDLIVYKIKNPKAKLLNINLFPVLNEKTSFTLFDAHYFYQQIWAFENIMKAKPKGHVDIGSTYQMSGYLSKIVPTIFVDIRPINTQLKNLKVRKGDILNLPFEDDSVESLSCLHVVEHIGLGRYGDKIDPNGPKKACKELSRILKKGGRLYFSIPVGKKKICFNAHRVIPYGEILNYFKRLKLVNFSLIDDKGKFIKKTQTKMINNLNYGCGLFEFKKI
jgi:SAM-dependent methyltransferase